MPVILAERVHRNGGMGISAAGAHLGGNPDRLHDLLVAGAFAPGELRVVGHDR